MNISKIKNLISEIEANTINIKLEMETDKKKIQELKKIDDERKSQLPLEKIKKGKIDKKGESERIKLQIDLQNRQKKVPCSGHLYHIGLAVVTYSRSNVYRDQPEPCRDGLRREPSHGQYREWHRDPTL